MKIPAMMIVFVVAFLSLNCDDSTSHVSRVGTVIHLSFEGGFYGITTREDHFLPENLPQEFQKDSILVYFEGTLTDRITTYQWGRTITLTRIERVQ